MHDTIVVQPVEAMQRTWYFDPLMNDWTPVLSALFGARRCLITSHVNPDGDALGSEAALQRWLSASGVEARIVNEDSAPPRYRFLETIADFEVYARPARPIEPMDVTLILDVARLDRIGAVHEFLSGGSAGIRICIDHHPLDGAVPADLSVIDPTAAATGELLFEMMRAAGRLPDRDAALALYVAIMTDTGSFRHGNTTPRTHRIVADLMEHPFDVAELYDRIYGTSTSTRFRLLGEALRELDVIDGTIAVLTITKSMMDRHSAGPEDVDGFSEMARGVEGCRVAAVFTELAPARIKVSLRSRGSVDVNHVAREFGGGGHAMAAGITTAGSLESVRAGVIAALRRSL